MGRPELASDERFATNRARMADQERTDATVQAWTSELSREQIYQRALDSGAVAAPVRRLDEVMHDPHMHERGMLVTIDHPDLGQVVMPTTPIRHHGSPPPQLTPSPGLGEHNREIYGDWLGLADAELQELAAQGVI
jgi:crotonobetainyl-CoA:carnitine CoA-transferase CaiB-like acyl-CoA transferase